LILIKKTVTPLLIANNYVRESHDAIYDNDKIYIFGGVGHDFAVSKEVLEISNLSDPENYAINVIKESDEFAVQGNKVLKIGNKIFNIGGEDNEVHRKFASKFVTYNIDTQETNSYPDFIGIAFFSLTKNEEKGEYYIYGGGFETNKEKHADDKPDKFRWISNKFWKLGLNKKYIKDEKKDEPVYDANYYVGNSDTDTDSCCSSEELHVTDLHKDNIVIHPIHETVENPVLVQGNMQQQQTNPGDGSYMGRCNVM